MPASQIRDWFQRRPRQRHADLRRLQLEELECRALLSVTAGSTSIVIPDTSISPAAISTLGAAFAPEPRSHYILLGAAETGSSGTVVSEPPVSTPGTNPVTNPGSPSPPGAIDFSGGVTVAGMRKAYGVDQSGLDGAGVTIGIVETGYIPFQTVMNALTVFDQAMNISGHRYTVSEYYDPFVGTPPASFLDVGVETMLDIEWAHAMAPAANIVLVANPDIFDAAHFAATWGGASVVSISYGVTDIPTNSFAVQGIQQAIAEGEPIWAGSPNVAFLASTGDQKEAEEFGYPAESSNVIAVGGTQFFSNDNPVGGKEQVWAGPGYGGGGGVSTFFSRPSYQSSVFSGAGRGLPDVSMCASDAWVYDPYEFSPGQWLRVGGTSLSCPMFAGLVADVDQGRAQNGQGPIGTAELHTKLYALAASSNYSSLFNDITTGNNNFYPAGPGYDLATGLGTPKASALEAALIGSISAPSQFGPSGTVPTQTPTFSWSAVTGATNYQLTIVDQSTGKNVTTPITLTGTSYSAPSGLLSAGHAYSWTVTAVSSSGGSAASANLAFSTPALQPLVAPTFSATPASSTQVNLNWSASGATSYNLYQFKNGGPVLMGTYAAGVSSATISGLSPGTSYAFNLVAFTSAGPKATAWVGATTPVGSAKAVLMAMAISNSQVILSWSASGATSFNLYKFDNGAPVLIGSYPASVTTATISGLAAGTSYAFNVVAFTGSGTAASQWVGATTSGTSASASNSVAKSAASAAGPTSAGSDQASVTGSIVSGMKRPSSRVGLQ